MSVYSIGSITENLQGAYARRRDAIEFEKSLLLKIREERNNTAYRSETLKIEREKMALEYKMHRESLAKTGSSSGGGYSSGVAPGALDGVGLTSDKEKREKEIHESNMADARARRKALDRAQDRKDAAAKAAAAKDKKKPIRIIGPSQGAPAQSNFQSAAATTQSN